MAPYSGFDDDGIVLSNLSSLRPGYEYGYGVATADDGSVAVLAYTEAGWTLVRYLPDGGLDDAFGNAGKVVLAQAINIYQGSLAMDSQGDSSSRAFGMATARETISR